MKEQPKEIPIDSKTQVLIKELVRNINDLQARLQLIMQTIVNVTGAEGEYKLSGDLTKLVNTKQDGEV